MSIIETTELKLEKLELRYYQGDHSCLPEFYQLLDELIELRFKGVLNQETYLQLLDRVQSCVYFIIKKTNESLRGHQ